MPIGRRTPSCMNEVEKMKFTDKLRNILDIPKVTEDGLKYKITGEEVKIVGYSTNASFTQIPSHIEGLPVGVISGLQNVPFSGELYLPDTVHTLEPFALDLTKHITKIVIPDSVKNISHHVFDFSEALEEIIFPDRLDLSDAEGLLSGCGKLTAVRLPADMSKMPLCFLSDCTSLTEIILPDSITEIGDCAFSYCENLRTVRLPKSLKKLGDMAFSECTALEALELPEGLECIDSRAFSGCENLRSINIPSTVKNINKHAFEMCEKLAKPEIPPTCTVDEKAFV